MYIYFDGVIIGIVDNDINYIENSNSLLDNVPIYYLSLASETFKDKNELLKDFKNYNIEQKKETRFFYENNEGKCFIHEINEEFLKNKISNGKNNKIYNLQELLFNFLYNESNEITIEEGKEYIFNFYVFENINIVFFVENIDDNLFINNTKIANNKETFNIVNEQNRKNNKVDKETIYFSNFDFENIRNMFVTEYKENFDYFYKIIDLNIFKYQSNFKDKSAKNISWLDSDNIFKIEEIIKNLSKEKIKNLIKYTIFIRFFLGFNFFTYYFLLVQHLENKTEELNNIKKEVVIIEDKFNKISADKFFDILEKNKNDKEWNNILYINSYLKKINLEPINIIFIPVEEKNKTQYIDIEVLGFINKDLEKNLKKYLAVEEITQIVEIINGKDKPSYKLKLNFDKIDFTNNFYKGIK